MIFQYLFSFPIFQPIPNDYYQYFRLIGHGLLVLEFIPEYFLNSVKTNKHSDFHIYDISVDRKFFMLMTMIKNDREYESDHEEAQLFAEHYKKRYRFIDDRNNREHID